MSRNLAALMARDSATLNAAERRALMVASRSLSKRTGRMWGNRV